MTDPLASLTELGNDLHAAEIDVLRAEAALKKAKMYRDKIAMTTIPDFLEELGVESITLSGGKKVEVKDVLRVAPVAANRPLVLAELDAQGAGSLIKTTVSVPFNRGEDEAVKVLLTKLQEDGLVAKVDTRVEPQTLKKHVKDRLEAGKPLDLELFGVRKFKQAFFSKGGPKKDIFDGE